MQREKFIDAAKGIGILLVVYAHVININKLSDLSAIVDCIYAFHMPLFFFISGYCFGLKNTFEGSRKSYLLSGLKKIGLRLMVPYLVWSIVYMFIAGLMTNVERIKAVLTLRGIAPLWFLAALALCEVVFICIEVLTHKLNNKGKIWVHIAICVLCIVAGYIMRSISVNSDLSTQNNGVATYYLFVTIGRFFLSYPVLIFGYLFAKINIIKRIGRLASGLVGVLLMGLLAVVVCVSGMTTNVHTFQISNYWLFICTALLGSVGTMMISYSFAQSLRTLNFMGRNSLAIMVLHYTPFKTIAYSSDLAQLIASNDAIFSVVACVLTLTITVGGIWLIKKRFFLYK